MLPDELRHSVDLWLDQIAVCRQVVDEPFAVDNPLSWGHVNEVAKQPATMSRPTTPPRTASRPSQSPKKRKVDKAGRAVTDRDECASALNDGESDQTPSSAVLPYRAQLPLRRPTSDVLTTASQGSYRTPSLVSEQAFKQRRSASPTKSTQSLRSLEKPVVQLELQDNARQQLPSDVHALYDCIFSIASEHECYLPAEVREDITAILGKMPGRHRFRDPTTGAGASEVTAEERLAARYPRTREPADAVERAIEELQKVRQIQAVAAECHGMVRSEAAWNALVHIPLLELALRPFGRVRPELVTTARIAAPFVPRVDAQRGGAPSEAKMVDISLLLWLNDGLPPLVRQPPVGDIALAAAIARHVHAQPSGAQTINQSAYRPLQYAPAAVSIETKVDGGSLEDARVQLGVWTAAWHRRLDTLGLGGGGSPLVAAGTIITLPLIITDKHEWTLYFACDRGDRIEIVGYMSIGSTNNLLGIYQLLGVLREIAAWIDGTFRSWLERALLSRNDDE